jgi:hypothetical protein
MIRTYSVDVNAREEGHFLREAVQAEAVTEHGPN